MSEPRTSHPEPWYRQFWPWFLIALPGCAVAASMVTIWLAVSSPNSMVVDDYSRIAKFTEQRRERDLRAAELGLAGRLRVVGDAGVVELVLLPEGFDPGALSVRLAHPTMENLDRRFDLARSPGGWTGRTEPFSGRWYVQIEPADGQWRLAGEISGSGEIELKPPSGP